MFLEGRGKRSVVPQTTRDWCRCLGQSCRDVINLSVQRRAVRQLCSACTWDSEALQGTESCLLDRGVPTLHLLLQQIQELVDDSQLEHPQAVAVCREGQDQAGERGKKTQ